MKTKILFVLLLLSILVTSMVSASNVVNVQNTNGDDAKNHELRWVKWDYEEPAFYEYNENGEFILNIFNNGNDTIKNFTIDVNSLSVNSVDEYCTFSNNIIVCKSDIIKNRGLSTLILLTAPSVSKNTNFTIEINTTDDKGFTLPSYLNITVIDDTILPTYTLVSPITNHTIIKNGTNYNFKINYTEIGSGIKSVDMFYEYGNPYDFASSTHNTTPFLNLSNLWSGNVNSSQFLDIFKGTLPFFKYKYELSDRAGNKNVETYNWIFLDNDLPTITLSTPIDISLLNKVVEEFNFTADDNTFSLNPKFNPSVDCGLYINNSLMNSSPAIKSTATQSLNANLTNFPDGIYSWYVECTDVAGWTNRSATNTFTLDTEGPYVVSVSHLNNSVVNNNTQIVFTLSDYNNVSKISYVNSTKYDAYGYVDYIINSSNFVRGDNLITIFVNDSIGNNNTYYYNFSMDDVAPVISNISGTVSGNKITISWDVDEISENQIFLSDGKNATIISSANPTHTFENLIYSTTYNYTVRSCDLVGNCNISGIYNVTTGAAPVVPPAKPNGGSSGGSSFYVCQEKWECEEWSECSNELQTRTCLDVNHCGTQKTIPALDQTCSFDNGEVNLGVSNSESAGDYEEVGIDSARNLITGQVTGDGSEDDTNGWTWILVTIAGLVAIVGGVTTYNTHFK